MLVLPAREKMAKVIKMLAYFGGVVVLLVLVYYYVASGGRGEGTREGR